MESLSSGEEQWETSVLQVMQTTETSTSNKYNKVKNPSWSKEKQMAVDTHDSDLNSGLPRTNQGTGQGGASGLQVQCSNHLATLLSFYYV